LNFALSTSPDSLIGASWKIRHQFGEYAANQEFNIEVITNKLIFPHVIIGSDISHVNRLIFSIRPVIESKICTTMHHLEIRKPGSKYYHKSDKLTAKDVGILEHT
jgi:hypothetical protein